MKTLALVVAVTLCASAAHAVVPQTMSYQGVLRDAAGNVVPDASYNLAFGIYTEDVGGPPIWFESQTLPVENGIFNAVLGHGVPLALPFDTTYWLGISIEGEPELSPRVELTSAPYAQRAAYADEGADTDWMFIEEDIYRLTGNVGIGLLTPSEKLDVEGTAKVTGFQLTTSPTPGHVLTSDASGVGTWQAASGGGISGGGTPDYVPKFVAGGTTIENSNIYETLGRVSIGTTTSDAKLRVENAFDLPGLIVKNTSPGQGFNLVELSRTGPMSNGDGFLQITAPVGAADFTYIHCWQLTSGGARTPFMVSAAGDISSTGSINVASGEPKALYVTTDFESDDTIAIEGRFFGPYDGTGVWGEANQYDYYGYGGQFQGGYVGAKGYVQPTGGMAYYGLHGVCDGGTGNNFGVVGDAMGAGGNFGIYGTASGGATNWAGYFEGDARVTGTFYNPLGALEIDHPLDPVERYLRQPAVHSSEMKNVYDGVVALGATGEAWVELPDWFEALNESFRYQLTAIGAPGPNLYVAEKISGNRFGIAGGEPGMEVSWQVTGVRHDPVAEQYAIQVEERKSDRERGKYLRPEAYGAPEEMGIGFMEGKEPGR